MRRIPVSLIAGILIMAAGLYWRHGSPTNANKAPSSIEPAKTKSNKKDVPDKSTIDHVSPQSANNVPDFEALFQQLTAENAAAIIERLLDHPDEARKRLGPFYRAWAELDGASAMSHAQQHAGKAQVSVMNRIIGAWALTDPPSAKDWFLEQTNKRAKGIWLPSTLLGLTKSEGFEKTAEWFAPMANEPYANLAFTHLAQRWAMKSPEAALSWLASLPEDTNLNMPVEAVFIEWGRRDPTTGSAFLATLKEGTFRDLAASAFVRTIVDEDLEAAQAWAASIADEELKQETVSLVSRISANSSADAHGAMPPLPSNNR